MRRAIVVPLVAAAFVAAGCGGSGSGSGGAAAGPPEHPSKLVGDVGHNEEFVISLKDPAGKTIKNLAAGTYTLEVDDESSAHNFHLQGRGVDAATGVPDKGTKTFTVTLTPGTYSFQCDPHAGTMHGSFKVT